MAFRAWRASLWFGLVVGLGELLIIAARSWFHDQSTPGNLQLNRHAAWMIPAANTIVFAIFGIVPGMLAGFGPKKVAGWATALPAGLFAATMLWMIHGLHAGASLLLAVGVACRFHRLLEGRRRSFDRLAARSLPVLIGIFGCLAVGDVWFVTYAGQRRASTPPPPTASASNVLLIVLDTVRADRTSLHGYAKDTTPNLARLAKRGITFENARAPAAWTLPTHASLLTGRWPFELSTRTHGPLDSTFPTLAEHMADRGYDTAGFVANTYFCNSWYGLGRGFMHYEDYPERNSISLFEVLRNAEIGQRVLRAGHTAFHTREGVVGGRKDAGGINREFLGWLGARPDKARPFFAFLNYYDAHDPYIIFDPEAPSLGFDPPRAEDLPLLHNWHTMRGGQISPAQRQTAGDAYDRCLSYLDDRLGRLFAELERTGVLETTTIIVTSDHGEQFGEHGIDLHGNSLYRPLVGVPLMIVPAGARRSTAAGLRVRTPVTLRDVPATVADLAGTASESPFPGRSLARFWHPESARSPLKPEEQGIKPDEDLILSETWLKLEKNPRPPKHVFTPVQWGPMRSLVGEGYVYIRLANGREELYDLEHDPAEVDNLAGRPEVAALLDRFRHRLAQVGWF
jgi:arylsulfatase A-like enzyme